jgi:NADH:ubiquinone oxidoreductase subunit 3 (subunit A)
VNRYEWTDAVTENPNTQPDPNAGQPPGEGAQSGGPAEAAKSEPIAATEPGEPAKPVEPGSETPGGQTPESQTPATGAFAETPWVEPSDEEELGLGEPIDPNAPKTSIAATFLPGIDAGSLLALIVAALGAGSFLLVNPLVQAHDAARTWSDFKNNVPRTKQDPFGLQRDWVNYQSWAMIILGLVAVLLALVVLALWTASRNKLRSRSFAQAALVLGLAVLLYGILLKTGAVGSEIPSLKDISAGLSSSSSQ